LDICIGRVLLSIFSVYKSKIFAYRLQPTVKIILHDLKAHSYGFPQWVGVAFDIICHLKIQKISS
jgi:hypothetical protein